MKSKIFVLVAMALVANTSFAGPRKARETGEGPGVAAGSIAGAVLGGPVGFVIGGGLGGWISNRFHQDRKDKEELAAQYEQADKLARSLEKIVAKNENDLQQMRIVLNDQQDSYRTALRQALDIEVFFRTGESTLDDQVAKRVERLGSLMREFDDFSIVVEGHADQRGDDAYNAELSAARATAVRDALVRSGLPAERITTRGAGEEGSVAGEGDLDGMAMDRRVNLSIVYPIDREARVAQQ